MARSLNELGSLYYKPLPQLSEYYLINLCKCITTDSVLRVMTKVMNIVHVVAKVENVYLKFNKKVY